MTVPSCHQASRSGIPPRLRGRRAVCLWLSVLVLLWAQGMGLWHRLAHDPRATGGVVVATSSAPTAQAFGHPAGDEHACRAYDHLALADLLTAVPVVFAVVATPAPTVAPVADGIAPARPRHYSARAPPMA